MADVSYNNQPVYSPPVNSVSPPPQFPSSGGEESSPGLSAGGKKALIIGSIIIILLSILLILYLFFGRSATKPLSPSEIQRTFPSGPPPEAQ